MEEKKEFLKRKEVKTMQKEIARLQEEKTKEERERIAGLDVTHKTTETIVKKEKIKKGKLMEKLSKKMKEKQETKVEMEKAEEQKLKIKKQEDLKAAEKEKEEPQDIKEQIERIKKEEEILKEQMEKMEKKEQEEQKITIMEQEDKKAKEKESLKEQIECIKRKEKESLKEQLEQLEQKEREEDKLPEKKQIKKDAPMEDYDKQKQKEKAITEIGDKKKALEVQKTSLQEKKNQFKETLAAILLREGEAEEKERKIEEKEKATGSAKERREIEQKRWEVEKHRQKIEQERWEVEKEKENTDSLLRKIKQDLRKITEKEKELKEKKEEEERKIEERKLIDKELKKIRETFQQLEVQKTSLQEKKNQFKETLAAILLREGEAEEKERKIEEKEKAAGSARERREIEQERWEAEKHRQKIEQERWDVEKEKENTDSLLRKIKQDLRKITEKEEELEKKIGIMGDIPAAMNQKSVAEKVEEISPEITEKKDHKEGMEETIKEIPVGTKDEEKTEPLVEETEVIKEKPQIPDKTEAEKVEEISPEITEKKDHKKSVGDPDKEATIATKDEEKTEPLVEETEVIKEKLQIPDKTEAEKVEEISPEITEKKDYKEGLGETIKEKSGAETGEKNILSLQDRGVVKLRETMSSLQKKEEIERKKFLEKIYGKGGGTEEDIPEGDAQPEKAPVIIHSPARPSKIKRFLVRFLILLMILGILAGLSGIWYQYWYSEFKTPYSSSLLPPAQDEPKTTTDRESLIPVAAVETLEINNIEEISSRIAGLLQEKTFGEMFTGIIIKDLTQNKIIGLKEFFEAVGVQVPENFYQKMDNDITLFVFSSDSGQKLGFISKVKEFEGFREIILDWESTIETDTEEFFKMSGDKELSVGPLFQEFEHFDEIFRYHAFKEESFGIAWATPKDHLIFTSSYESMIQTIDQLK